MSSVSGIRLPGLATGMDTDTMIKEMLTGEQNKIDKVKQKEQTVKWQQEIYREIIKDVKGLNDKYLSLSSKNSIISSGAWNTLTVSSSNPNIITATGTAGANNVDYNFDVKKLAQPPRVSSDTVRITNTDGSVSDVEIKKNSNLKDLGLLGETTFAISYGDGEKSKPITIRTEPIYETDTDGNFIYEKDADGNDKLDTDGNPIKKVKEPSDTISTLIKKINDATGGKVKASYSEMSGTFNIESIKTGSDSEFKIVDDSTALNFLGLKTNKVEINNDGTFTSQTIDFNGSAVGSDSIVAVKSNDGSFSKILNEKSNSFTIDGIKYDVHTIGTSDIKSKKDVKPVVENMKAFVEDYNKIMDKMYDLVTQKVNRDYAPLTEVQKEDMSDEEIERWEKKAKAGLLRNDSEMRRFMDDMQQSIFGKNMKILNEMGLKSHPDYNKKGQIALDEDKFIKALENNSDKVYEVFAKDSSSVMESMKSTITKYAGSSSSIFARKAGIEKTASVANNFYSEQLKKQEETIKKLQRKMSEKESQLYKKFSALEASMNKLNSQMNYFAQM